MCDKKNRAVCARKSPHVHRHAPCSNRLNQTTRLIPSTTKNRHVRHAGHPSRHAPHQAPAANQPNGRATSDEATTHTPPPALHTSTDAAQGGSCTEPCHTTRLLTQAELTLHRPEVYLRHRDEPRAALLPSGRLRSSAVVLAERGLESWEP